MLKFSIVVPVYNTYKYLDKCLKSILVQSYEHFEVIIINDGSTDNSKEIIDRYCKKDKRFISYTIKNSGLSAARNYGIDKTNGDYLLFIDSDDYIEKDLLIVLYNKLINNNYDLIKFSYQFVYEDKNVVMNGNNFQKEYTGEEFLKKSIFSNKQFEMAWLYAYNLDFWKENNFKFLENHYHEDFGLIPKIILMAKKITCIDYVGYNYLQLNSSITRTTDYNKTLKRVYDCLDIFDLMYKDVNESLNISLSTKKIFNSYISNALIDKIKYLNNEDKKKYINNLKKRNVFNLILSDNLKRKFKKIYYKLKYR